MKTLIEQFLSQYPRLHTRRAYKYDLIGFFGSPVPTDEELRAVTDVSIATHLLAFMRASGFSAARRKLSTLTRFYSWLVEQKLVHSNPAHAVVSTASFSVSDPQVAAHLATRELLLTFPEQAPAIADALRDHQIGTRGSVTKQRTGPT